MSTILGAAVPAQRAEQAWTEGVAIWAAVLVVSLVGARSSVHTLKFFSSCAQATQACEIVS